MAYEEAIRSITLTADASVALYTGPPGLPGSADPNGGFQYHVVKVTGAGECGLADTTANELPVGILQNKPQNTGMAATVAIRGVSRAKAGAVVAAGVAVKVDATGRVVTATLPTDAALVVGVTLGAAGAAEEIIPVLIKSL